MNLLDELGYVARTTFERLHEAIDADAATPPAPPCEGGEAVAADAWVQIAGQLLRYNTLVSVARAGTGHLGASLSMADLLAEIYFRRGRFRPEDKDAADRDIFILSKGHAAPGHYAALAAAGYLPTSALDRLRRWNGLPGHSHTKTPGVDANTGSLAMGLSRAVGFAIARQRFAIDGNVYVISGDGELQEGQAWEALLSAAGFATPNFHLIIDANKVQTDQYVEDILVYRDLPGTIRSLGFAVVECDGHSGTALRQAFTKLGRVTDRPRCLIAHTVKGSGVSYMEHPVVLAQPGARYIWHNKPPNAAQLQQALKEILQRVARAEARLERLGIQMPADVEQERVPREPAAAGIKGKALVPGFAEGVRELARLDPRVVVIDGDLEEDCGLTPFRDEFPSRFLELGIMEQHMCSTASAAAALGLVPIVVSYSAFLSSRSNEQIYNLATDPKARCLFVGHLAGVIPATPGMSHQALRDIGALRSIPGLRVYQPMSPDDCKNAVLRFGRGELGPLVYLRIVMAPPAVELPAADPTLPIGHSQILRAGTDAIIIAGGPVMAGEALAAAEQLAGDGVQAEVRHHPWAVDYSAGMLQEISQRGAPVLVCEDHYVRGGMGEGISAAFASLGLPAPPFGHVALNGLPDTGFRDEALRGMGLHRDDIVGKVLGLLPSRKRFKEAA